MFRNKNFFATALMAGLMMGAVTQARALDRDHDHDRNRDRKCEQQVRKAEHNLQNAVRRHGERSRQAENRRHQLEEVRERCHRR